jgi:hypothetical protein
MKKNMCTSLLAMSILLSAVCPAVGVQFGEPDGDRHPYVGMVVVLKSDGSLWYGSGTLLSPQVFLTAGHITDDAVLAFVTFDSEADVTSFPSPPSWILGTPFTHPFYGVAPFPDTSDVGVVILDTPIVLDEYGALPEELGLLDRLAKPRGPDYLTFTVVGYGLQGIKPRVRDDLVRHQGTVSLVNLRNAFTDGYNIQHTSNPGGGHGPGGTCFGDSGGPLFLKGTNVVVGVNSFGLNELCKGVGFAYRTDIENTQWFIDLFPPVP